MKRLQNHYYQQRILGLLAPLLLLALLTWWTEAGNSPYLSAELRSGLLTALRLGAPALLCVLITCLFPVGSRGYQILVTVIAYALLTAISATSGSSSLLYPTIPVLAATTSVFALLPKPRDFIRIRHPLLNSLVNFFFALSLPLLTAFVIISVMEQTTLFVRSSFCGEFARSDLEVIYVPLYFLLQAFGYHGTLADIATAQYRPERAVAFFNAVLMTMLFALPTAIFVRSLFTRGTLRITLTFLGICTILTSSIGTCASLVLAFVLIFFPGTFIILAVSSAGLFLISVNLEIPQLVAGTNLYRPDINLSFLDILYTVPQSRYLILAAILMPLLAIPAAHLLRMDKDAVRRGRHSLGQVHAGPALRSAPDLQVIALLRAVGGLSNLRQFSLSGSALMLEVNDTAAVSVSQMAAACTHRVSCDHSRRLYTCELGESAPLIARRLGVLGGDFLGHSGAEIALAPPYPIPAQYFAEE